MTDRHKTRARPAPRRGDATPFMQVLAEGASRRTLLKGLLAASALAATGLPRRALAAATSPSTLTFAELERVTDTADHWPEGYRRQILLRWGDPLFADAPALIGLRVFGQSLIMKQDGSTFFSNIDAKEIN